MVDASGNAYTAKLVVSCAGLFTLALLHIKTILHICHRLYITAVPDQASTVIGFTCKHGLRINATKTERVALLRGIPVSAKAVSLQDIQCQKKVLSVLVIDGSQM